MENGHPQIVVGCRTASLLVGQIGPVIDLQSRFGILPFTRADAMEAGLSAWQWRLAVKRGLVQPLGLGVYCAARPDDARLRHCQATAAALLRKTDHLAIGTSALAVHDLPNPYFRRWDRLPVALAGKKSRPERNTRLSTAVPIGSPWGPVTDLVDTAATIAAELPLPQALMVTDAIARKLAGTTDRFVLASERCRTEVRRLLTEDADLPALRLANPAAESPAESFYRGNMLMRGLPEPACGVPMRGRSGAQYFVDMLIQPLAIEVDGRIKYTDLRVLIDEKKREDDLRATGLAFHRSFVEDLYANPAHEMDLLQDKAREIGPWGYGPLALPA